MSDALLEKHGTITKKEFKEFQKWVDYYVDLFGLTDVSIYVGLDGMAEGLFATAETDLDSRFGIVTLNKTPKYKLPLRDIAVHEVMHIVLSGVRDLATERSASVEQIEAMHEAETVRMSNIIRKIENDSNN